MNKIAPIFNKSIIASLIAFIIFTPITGFVLDNYHYQIFMLRPLTLSLSVFIVSLLFFSYKAIKHKTNIFHFTPLTSLKTNMVIPHQYLICIIMVAAMVLPWLFNNYWLTIAILAMIYILLGLGLNIVVGMAGLLDLGFVAFYAVGAYTYALGAHYFDLSFWAAIPLGALFAATFGVLLGFPVLKMHGDYLAIVTLGFGEIIRLILNNWVSFTGGPNGLSVPKITFFGLPFSRYAPSDTTTFHQFFNLDYSRSHQSIFIYILLLFTVITVIYIIKRLKKMPIGRAWEALREDEIASRSLGIYHVTAKLSAFSIGACIGGLGGVFFASYQNFVNPSSFTFIESALILAIVVLGGMGSIIGVIIAAIVMTVLPEILRDFSSYRLLIFGLLMVLMMIWRPNGFIKMRRPIFFK